MTAGRAFAAVSLPLAELKTIGKAHDATINDMVLMVVSTALRRYLGKQHTLPRKSLIAAVPISLRKAGDTTSDNQASLSLISLGTHLADPMKRLEHIRTASAAMKSTLGGVKSILPTDFPSLGLPWLIEAATSLYGKAKVADRIPQVANVVISNVPGPPMPLYLAGARMLTNYPTSIVVHGMAFNITVQSYDRVAGLRHDGRRQGDARREGVRAGDGDRVRRPARVAVAARAAGRGRRTGRGGGPRGARGARSAVSDAVKGVVGGAMQAAVGQVVRGAVKAAAGSAHARRQARRHASQAQRRRRSERRHRSAQRHARPPRARRAGA